MTGLRFLLDTNILSEPLRPHPNPNVMAMLAEHDTEIATATVVYHEMLFGRDLLPESKKRRALELYLQREIEAKLPVLPYDLLAAQWHASERARLVKLGKTPSFADGQIAAISQANDLILVTNNKVDFESFLDLQLENWFA
ncbi:type II toxin-antitoxin system VapC family toxin [Pseudanabaena sp. PCC 6802]|uniref:type II toxin-antitoxin system VapC family toxin n=1 Tax=Pseudanabaena sp. PCC 6802 TaxID=118173 RepID=UPI000344FC63|nr:type II toxin-antitoxin system VapC family toxin [Pseudanabaena sp. PCC 6802]